MAQASTLTTPRLLLRAPKLSDAAAFLAFRGDAEVQRYDDPPLQSLDEATSFLKRLQDEVEHEQAWYWAMTLNEAAGEVVGLCSLWNRNAYHRRAELGYSLRRDHWGQGLAGEGVARIVDHGFHELGLHRIEAYTIRENVRSAQLLQRLGFLLEGSRRERSLEDDGQFHDSMVYGLLRTDPRELGNSPGGAR